MTGKDSADALVPTGIEIITGNENFEKTVSVFGSDDKEKWEKLCENQPIYDYSRFMDIRDTTVEFKGKRYKYYKIVIDNVSQALISSFSRIFAKYSKGKMEEEYASFIRDEGVLHLDGMEFFSKTENEVYGENKESEYALEISEIKEDEKRQVSSVFLLSSGQPLSKLLLEVKDKNFRRKVEVEVLDKTGVQDSWLRLVSAEIYRDNTSGGKKEKLDIPLIFSKKRYKEYKIKIYNRDNRPLDITGVKAKGIGYEVLFFHEDKKEIKLFYGGEGIDSPQYDISSIVNRQEFIETQPWILGKEYENKKVKEKTAAFLNPQQLLTAILTLMVLVLVFIIGKAVKKVDGVDR